VDKSYSTFALGDLLDAFASSDPAPGGGSAAALAGALGVSLLLMAAGITRTRTGAAEEAADLAEASARLRPLRERLMALIDEDSEAYRQVMAALRLPKGTGAENTARADAIQLAIHGATDTPLDTMRACQQALRGAVVVAGATAKSAASDVGVAIELLVAAVQGAALNVDTNLAGLDEPAFVARAREERNELEAESLADAAAARERL
jgi:formiminotetrahydrofolate cyclodeaminase